MRCDVLRIMQKPNEIMVFIYYILVLINDSNAQRMISRNNHTSTNNIPALALNNFRDDLINTTINRISFSVQKFGLDMLFHVAEKAEESGRDIMISPISIWSLLILMLEASSEQTYEQLRQGLYINIGTENLRSAYGTFLSTLNVKSSSIEVASLQAIYTDISKPINPEYSNILKSYNIKPKSVDFGKNFTYNIINEETSQATNGLIEHTILPQDVYNAKIFLLSSLYFRGRWKFPFNRLQNQVEPFYNEFSEVLGNVEMMTQEGDFPYSSAIDGLDGYVLQLPYGDMQQHSMIIILPKHGFTLCHITENLRNIGISALINGLAAENQFSHQKRIEVHLPKFSTTSDLTLNSILRKMGITDMFSENAANLSKLSNDLFVNLFIHSTRIIVNEEGTIASAISTATLIDKGAPPKFYLNKPFQYLIVEKKSNLLLFAGQIRNPTKN